MSTEMPGKMWGKILRAYEDMRIVIMPTSSSALVQFAK